LERRSPVAHHSEVRGVANGKEIAYHGKKVGFSLPGWDL